MSDQEGSDGDAGETQDGPAEPSASDVLPGGGPNGPDRDNDTPATAVFDRVRESLVGDQELSLEEVAEQAGLPVRILEEVLEVTGWHDRPGYDQQDVEYASGIAELLDHYPLGTVLRSLRIHHRSLGQIVVSDLGTVRDQVVDAALEAGVEPDELAERLGETADTLLPLVIGTLAEHYRHILIDLLDTEAVARGVEGGGEVELAVGFVDVVGYTTLSGQVDPGGLDRVLTSFEDLVDAAVNDTDDVMLVKFVGDAAMMVASDVAEVVETLLDLVEDRRRLAEAPRRAGLSAGSVLVRGGDYYGPVANLAARLTDHANPWSLLASEDLEEALEDDFELTEIPEISVQGFGERRPLRVRRPDGDEDDD